MFRCSECWGERPAEVEVTATCVFVRRDFEQIEQVEDGTLTGVTGWSYMEARMTAGEYAEYAAMQLQSYIDEHEAALSDVYDALIELAEQE